MTKNGRALLWVAALMLVVLYVYAVSAFAFLRQDYADSDAQMYCSTTWQVGRLLFFSLCVVVVADLPSCVCL